MSLSVGRIALPLLAAAWIFRSADASAQSNAAIAEQLFLDGQKLMDAGHFADACKKFTDSQRLDPAIGTLMHLAACHEKAGKVATAWSEFNDVAAQAQKAGQAQREKYARDHAAALDSKLQKVIIELSHPADGTTIRLDGSTLPLGVLGTEVPLDPGDHALEVTAPGMKPWRQNKLNLGPSAVITRVQVTLEPDVPSATPTPIPPASLEPNKTPGTRESPPAPADHTTTRMIGYALGVLGVASIAVGVGEEITSIGRNNDESKFDIDPAKRQMVADQSSQAQTYAIIFGGAGLAAAGAAVYLVLTSRDAAAPPSGQVRVIPLMGREMAGAGLHLAW
jgi:hypothetical protein